MGRNRDGKRPKHTLEETLRELGRQSPGMLATLNEMLALLQARPGATRVLANPVGIHPRARIGEFIKRHREAEAGKPIPFEIDYLDGSPPVVIHLPDHPHPDASPLRPRTRNKSGRKPRLTGQEYADFVARYRTVHAGRAPSLRQAAKALRCSRTAVTTAREEAKKSAGI